MLLRPRDRTRRACSLPCAWYSAGMNGLACALLVVEHACVECRALPGLPAGTVLPGGASYVALGYRPPKPRPVEGGPRSLRCLEHRRAHRRAQTARAAATRKLGKYGLPVALQLALWQAQGCACPCGNMVAPTPPPGIHMDHNHDLAALHDHPDSEGCPRCVTGYLCPSCNRDIVGRLTGHRRGRAGVPAALCALAQHLVDPPLARLLEQRPELLDPSSTGAAA